MRVVPLTLLAALTAVTLAGCGGEDAPDLGNEEAEAAWVCLDEEGYAVGGGRAPEEDRDAADVEITLRAGEVPILVAYYASEAEAQKRERDLLRAVAAQQGSVLRRGPVVIVTGGLPDAEDKAAIEGCVF